ncbi:MAG: putative ATP-dependent helicase Lhr [Firmicutes bacterium ADurb.Bin182]|nr:MAG: putative ATP-dependent helicase Lhr [Firmicutes bacterium ADurb.Bin182]
MSNPFYRLAPFIQEWIYAQRWEELRDAQIEACRVLFDTQDHLLIATGTASGKTEAAFFPALTQLYENPSRSVGILYIGPLKALINDQFERLNDLLNEANIPVWHWHGDVSQAEKTKLMRNPSGVLQITPESLEGLLMNRPNSIPSLFCDLRFIIVDEVHAFMNETRGAQLICQLSRIERMAGCSPRRIGLSATMDDYETAVAWLREGTLSGVSVVHPDAGRRILLAVEHFSLPDARDEEQAKALENARKAYFDYVYDHTHTKKSLIFTNSRDDAEMITRELRVVAGKRAERDVFYVHHGSISAMLREEAESKLRTGAGPVVTAATVTLELGIDLGDLDRVLQLGAPTTCSSFVQRLGRSGRRGNPPEMLFVCAEEEDEEAPLPSRIPWTLLRAVSVIELYTKDKWIEPFTLRSQPMGLLYHQTMSVLKSLGETAPARLAREVLSLPAFKNIDPEDYKALLRYLTETDHIQNTEEGTLIIGLAGERIVNNFRFYAVFKDDEEHSVYSGTEEIGSINVVPPPGYAMTLAGKAWRILEVDAKHKAVYVEPIRGKADTLWLGAGGDIHTRVIKKMYEILEGTEVYPYLRPNAAGRLERARRLAKESGLLRNFVLNAGGDTLFILPWLGSRQFRTLTRELKLLLSRPLGLRKILPTEPYYLTVAGTPDADTVAQAILRQAENPPDPYSLMEADEAPYLGKYDEFVPHALLRKAFAADGLDIEGMSKEILSL